MNFVPVNEEIVPIAKIRSENQKMLIEFMESNYDCVEVVNYPQKSAESCAASLCSTRDHLRLYGVIITRRKNRVFLIRKVV